MNTNVFWEGAAIDAQNSMLTPTTLAVTGMSCARTIERKLRRVPGVKTAVVVDLQLGVAIVNGTAARSNLIAATEAARYGASRERGCDQRTR